MLEMENNQIKNEKEVEDVKEQTSKKSKKMNVLNANLESEGKRAKELNCQTSKLNEKIVESNDLIVEKEQL